MNQAEQSPKERTAPASRYFRIAVGLLAAWLLCSVAAAVLLVFESASINRSGGWGWLLFMGIFVAATTVAFFACAICAGLSLWRREAHRQACTVILIGTGLIVLVFGTGLIRFAVELSRQHAEESRISKIPPGLLADAIRRTAIPNTLVGHLRNHEIILRPRTRDENHEIEYILERAGVGPRCEVVTRFVIFPSGTTAEAMKKHLMAISMPSLLNEQAGMAMFYPFARGTSSNKGDCEEWSAKSNAIVERFLSAFRSYQPEPLRNRLQQNQ